MKNGAMVNDDGFVEGVALVPDDDEETENYNDTGLRMVPCDDTVRVGSTYDVDTGTFTLPPPQPDPNTLPPVEME